MLRFATQRREEDHNATWYNITQLETQYTSICIQYCDPQLNAAQQLNATQLSSGCAAERNATKRKTTQRSTNELGCDESNELKSS